MLVKLIEINILEKKIITITDILKNIIMKFNVGFGFCKPNTFNSKTRKYIKLNGLKIK